MPARFGHAIVIGGSMAGLLAARVLANHFERVTIVERDQYPEEPVFRKGTPQARHVHGFLMRGQQILEELFPDIREQLLARGAIPVDVQSDFAMYNTGGWRPRDPSPLRGYLAGRILVEWQTQQLLRRWEQVTFLEQAEVIGLLSDPEKRAVTGVRVRARDRQPTRLSPVSELQADLVVDASGRHSHAPQWLQELGYPEPAASRVNGFWGEAVCTFRIPADAHYTWKTLFILTQPPKYLRGGVIWPVEGGDVWQVELGGCAGDYPPTDLAGFIEFARGMAAPDLYEAIKDAQPLSPVYGYRQMENQWYHYEKLSRQPEGFILIGDAVSAFNPTYGQGMSVAAQGAMLLDAQLHERRTQRAPHLRGLPRRFQRALAKNNQLPWQMAASAEYRVPGVVGGKPDAMTKLMYRYFDRLLILGARDSATHLAFTRVSQLLDPPSALFQPSIMLKVVTSR